VPSGRFDNASLTAISPPLISSPLQMSSYTATFAQGHVLEVGIMSPEAEWPSQTVVDHRSLAIGVSWALTIEGAAAFCLYAVWHLWHLWR
jgi:hypothetical protein